MTSERSSGPCADEAPLERGRFRLTAEPIEAAVCLAEVGDPTCGGTALFVGTTRDRNRGEDVVQLDYEAFGEMAGPEMSRIFQECIERFGSPAAPGGVELSERRLRMLAVHRTGTVAVGEVSVLIAVASPHRDAAFKACRFLIDTLKSRLPVWKKEIYRDGQHWIGDRS